MTDQDLTPLEAAHARAVVALLNTVPQLYEDEATEIVDSLVALMLETIRSMLPNEEESNATDYN